MLVLKKIYSFYAQFCDEDLGMFLSIEQKKVTQVILFYRPTLAKPSVRNFSDTGCHCHRSVLVVRQWQRSKMDGRQKSIDINEINEWLQHFPSYRKYLCVLQGVVIKGSINQAHCHLT